MPSSQVVQKLLSNLEITQYDFDPDSTNPVDVAWVDMKDKTCMLFGFFRTVGTGDIDTFRVIANSEPDGSGTDVIVKTKSLTGVQPNAVGDYTFIEVTAEEVRGVDTDGLGLRYVSLQIEFATATDEGVVTYIAKPRFPRENATADVIA